MISSLDNTFIVALVMISLRSEQVVTKGGMAKQ